MRKIPYPTPGEILLESATRGTYRLTILSLRISIPA